jgi:hypothetical protein
MPPSLYDRVLIADGHWTPFRNEIFSIRLGSLEQRGAAALYAVLYDRAYHRSSPIVKATLAELSEWSGLKERVIKGCLDELQDKRLVRPEEKSNSHRRSGRPRWRVPLAASFDLKKGNWTPIPRFLILKYIPAYPDSVLLLLLLHYQHFNWENTSFPNLPTLALRIGWSHDHVDRAIRTMSTSLLWKKLRTGLPRPLTSERLPSPYGVKVHYHVRAVRYESRDLPIVRLPKLFSRKFCVPSVKME